MTQLNDDIWKDDYLSRPIIFHAEFLNLPQEHKSWLLGHKHVFYNKGVEGFVNLIHVRNKSLADELKRNAYFKKGEE